MVLAVVSDESQLHMFVCTMVTVFCVASEGDVFGVCFLRDMTSPWHPQCM